MFVLYLYFYLTDDVTTDPQSITRLIERTDIRYWRAALLDMIKPRLMPEAHRILQFLLSNVSFSDNCSHHFVSLMM